MYNPASNAPPILIDNSNSMIGLYNASVVEEDGLVNCSFERVVSLSVQNYFNLSNPYYLLIASGPINDGKLKASFLIN
jgi:hypothetical protein